MSSVHTTVLNTAQTTSAPSALYPEPLPCTWCLFGHLQLDWRAMPWAGCWGAPDTPWECQLHLQTSLSARVFFFLLQQLLQGSTWPVSGYGHRPSSFAENCLITGYLKPMFCLVCFTSSQCVNTALSRTKQTFVASLPSDFWSLGHFSLAINKAQYQLSTIASLIIGFKVLT